MVRFDKVKKRYKEFELDVSMKLEMGRVTGLIGKNGAGKSTVIRLMTGLVKPDAGEIEVFGVSADKMGAKEKERIGVALADAGFSSLLQIKDICAVLKRMYPGFEEAYFWDKCKEYEIPVHKSIKEFSTGMKAKMRVLVAMSHGADLLILDEPTAGLDVETRNKILDTIREYLAEDEKRSVLLTSHISSDLEGICDDVYLIHEGKLILHEDTDVILDQYAILKVEEDVYQKMDQTYIIKSQKMNYGYACFAREKDYYRENYPGIVVENAGVDELILMMTGGYR